MVTEETKVIHPMSCTAAAQLRLLCAADKSLTHRAIMFAALAQGKSTIISPLLGDDCLSTLHCMERLGVKSTLESDRIVIVSPGMDHFARVPVDLDCGNSGTTTRLLIGLLAGLKGVDATFHGDQSLSARPMGRVVEPLQAMGADITYLTEQGKLPLKVRGHTLKAMDIHVNKATAQVKSALLLAGLSIDGTIKVILPLGSRDHTEKILVRMQAPCVTEHGDNQEIISFNGPFRPTANNYHIPVDPSSAAFFAVLGLLCRPDLIVELPFVLDNSSRTGFWRVLGRMCPGALAARSSAMQGFVEEVLDLTVRGGAQLNSTDIGAAEVPSLVDEIPILAVAAMFAQGSSRFCGLSELKVKESNRLAKSCELINIAGGDARIEGDDLIINGPVAHLRHFVYDPLLDHRLAMAAAVLAKISPHGGIVKDPACVAVSFPNFFALLDQFV